MRYIIVVLFVYLLVGCSSKDILSQKSIQEEIEIYDLVNIPQDIGYFTNNIDTTGSLYNIQNGYESYYFNVWNNNKPRESLESIKWPFKAFVVGKSYGENLELLKQEYFDEMYENANFDSFGTLNKNAVTLNHTDIRAFPSIRPLLKDPTIAGEGFPFDYLQNSSIYANKPLFISHYSKDKEWVYAFSSFTSGWIKTNEIVFIEQKNTKEWQDAQQIFLTKENVALYSIDGDFLFKSKIGMMLALIDEDENFYTALGISAHKHNKPYFVKLKISKSIASKDYLVLNSSNLEHIISQVSKSNYGWGGMYGQRDCSSTIRDIFAPFGIWLPRNSFVQSKVGKIINLEDLNDEEKISLIKKEAIPFQTLIYKKGHIVLYLGTYNDEVVAFHNTWGIKTAKNGVEGRIVIGKSVISSLRLGSKQRYYDKDSEILKNLKSMNILTAN